MGAWGWTGKVAEPRAVRSAAQAWSRRVKSSSIQTAGASPSQAPCPNGFARGLAWRIRAAARRTARVYEKRDYSGRWVCITRSGGSIHDLRGYNLNDQTRSLKINRNDCG